MVERLEMDKKFAEIILSYFMAISVLPGNPSS